jgi:hypothetical protein
VAIEESTAEEIRLRDTLRGQLSPVERATATKALRDLRHRMFFEKLASDSKESQPKQS